LDDLAYVAHGLLLGRRPPGSVRDSRARSAGDPSHTIADFPARRHYTSPTSALRAVSRHDRRTQRLPGGGGAERGVGLVQREARSHRGAQGKPLPVGDDEVEAGQQVPRLVVVHAPDGGAPPDDLAGVEGYGGPGDDEAGRDEPPSVAQEAEAERERVRDA